MRLKKKKKALDCLEAFFHSVCARACRACSSKPGQNVPWDCGGLFFFISTRLTATSCLVKTTASWLEGWRVEKQTQCVERARWAYFRADKHIPDTFCFKFRILERRSYPPNSEETVQLFLRWELLVVRGPIQGCAKQFSTYTDATWIHACLGKSKRAILAEEKKKDTGMFSMSYGGFVEVVVVVGGFRMSCYLGALIISVIKPSENTCTAWIIHQQLQGHLVRFVIYLFFPLLRGRAKLANLSQEKRGCQSGVRANLD